MSEHIFGSQDSQESRTGPLAGLTVLELGHFIAAPFCTRLLADMGATVIKVEPPGDGDPVRSWGEMVDGRSVWWSVHGRNKKSITINLKSPEGRQLVLDLVRRSRIVVENYKPGQLERWGLGPDVMASTGLRGHRRGDRRTAPSHRPSPRDVRSSPGADRRQPRR
jgi:crotonobetainyl-CoA:carnitine CoA-transferase CaiB-like acyl-CoA transferase